MSCLDVCRPGICDGVHDVLYYVLYFRLLCYPILLSSMPSCIVVVTAVSFEKNSAMLSKRQDIDDFKPSAYKVRPVRHHSFCCPSLFVNLICRCWRERIQSLCERRTEHVRQKVTVTPPSTPGLAPSAAVRLRRQPEAVEEGLRRRLATDGVPRGQIDRRRDELAVCDKRRQRRQPASGSHVGDRLMVTVDIQRRLVVPVAIVVVNYVVDRLLVKLEVVADVRAQGSTPAGIVFDDVRV